MEEYAQFAKSVVREASMLVKGMSHQSSIKYTKDKGDLVTAGDLAVHDYVRGRIGGTYPEHGFLSEEADDNRTGNEFVWILDPIDGTKYFSRLIPIYSISLALQENDKLVAGAVLNPETQQMFAGYTGGGANLNGLPIHCSEREALEDCIICVETPGRFDSAEEREWSIEQIRKLTEHSLRVRIIGAMAHGLCWTAMGGFDAYVNLRSSVRIWDVAASRVILEEAGGRYQEINGHIVAARPAVSDRLIELLDL